MHQFFANDKNLTLQLLVCNGFTIMYGSEGGQEYHVMYSNTVSCVNFLILQNFKFILYDTPKFST